MKVFGKRYLLAAIAGISTLSGVCFLFSSCGQQAPVPPKPSEVVRPAVVVPEKVGSLGLIFSQGLTSAQFSGESGTGVIAAVAISVSNQIVALRSEIVDVAGRRGAVAGQLSELRRSAMLRDNVEIKAIDSEIRARRDALVSKLNELPEVVAMKKAVDEIENKKKELLLQRVAINERRNKPAEDGSATNSAEQVKVIDNNLRAFQKDLQVSLVEHRKLVQQAREKNPEINALMTEISEKEAALVNGIDSLSGIKELVMEQIDLESRLRDLKVKLRILTNSETQSRAAPLVTNAVLVVPK